MMQQMLNSPMMQSLLNNPDLMSNLILNNPQLQSMMDANPQIRHILNDPEVSFFLSLLLSLSFSTCYYLVVFVVLD